MVSLTCTMAFYCLQCVVQVYERFERLISVRHLHSRENGTIWTVCCIVPVGHRCRCPSSKWVLMLSDEEDVQKDTSSR